METPESTIEICPDGILDDVGSSFVMGISGGSAFHFIRGIYSSPIGARLSGGAEYVRMNAPRVGGSFAVWGGLFSTLDCAIVYARQKEDAWNMFLAGAGTGSLLTLRRGLRASGTVALVSGTFIAVIERTLTAVNIFASAEENEEAFMGDATSLPPGEHMGQVYGQSGLETSFASAVGSRSWFGGWFESGKKESEDKSGSTTQILESFDAPHHVPTTNEFN